MVDIASIKGGADKKALGAAKQPKIKLTKDQVTYVNHLVKLENRIAVCREYIQLWMNFFRFFAEDLTKKEISAEEEKGFFQISTQLARKHFMFVELMGNTFERGNDIVNVLATAVSISNIQEMAENTRAKLDLDWHTIYLDMNKALGRLVRMLPGDKPLSEALASLEKIAPLGTNPAAGAKSGAKSKWLAALLAIPPLGTFGLHCFYLGLPKRALFCIVTLGLLSLVDLFKILGGKMETGDGSALA